MGHTTYQHEADRDFIEVLARGDWQKALLAGTEAWDGSTIRQVDWLAEKIARLGEDHADVYWHIENRVKWTDHLLARIKESGFVVRLDGPSARIERTDDTVDEPGVAEAAAAAGIADIPLQYHRISLAGISAGIAVYACVASAVYPFGPFFRANRFVLGGFEPVEIGEVSRAERVHTTLKKAINRTRKIRKSIDDWTAYRVQMDEIRRAREEARIAAEEAEAEAKSLAEDAEELAAAFAPDAEAA